MGLNAIIAVNNEGYIGLNGKLPWKSSADLQHFKQLTMRCNLICGYNTLKLLPTLPGRFIFADDRNTPESTIIQMSNYQTTFVIGGKFTYEKYCHLFDKLYISHINDHTIGDTLYPDLTNLKKDCKIFDYYFDVDV